MWALGTVPAFAYVGRDHLVRSSSVVIIVSYAPGTVKYNTFHGNSTESLRLSFKPAWLASGSVALSKRIDPEKDGLYSDITRQWRL